MCLAQHCTVLQLLNQNVTSSGKPRGILCFSITALPSLYRSHLFRLHDPWVRLKKIQEGKACACSSRADVRAGEGAFLAGNEMTQAPGPQQPTAETDNSVKAGPPRDTGGARWAASYLPSKLLGLNKAVE